MIQHLPKWKLARRGSCKVTVRILINPVTQPDRRQGKIWVRDRRKVALLYVKTWFLCPGSVPLGRVCWEFDPAAALDLLVDQAEHVLSMFAGA